VPPVDAIAATIPGSRIVDDRRLVIPIGGHDIAVAVAPRPGVVCAAELPGFDGYDVQITADGSFAELPVGDRSGDVLDITTNDRELTWALIDGGLRPHLVALRRGRSLVITRDEVRVLGDASPELTGSLAIAVARIAARPAELARRSARLFRRLGGIATGPRWNTVDFRITLATAPPVTVDWPRRGIAERGLVTRLRVETPDGVDDFMVVDTVRAAPPAGVAVPLAVPDVRSGRYVVVAETTAAVAAACTRLDPALRQLGDALPHRVAVNTSGVDVIYAGYEEQAAALVPAVTLARVLAGPSAHAPGPYR
jgi:hypothetical protein